MFTQVPPKKTEKVFTPRVTNKSPWGGSFKKSDTMTKKALSQVAVCLASDDVGIQTKASEDCPSRLVGS